MEEKIYKVYIHICLINLKVYIGMTMQDVKKRWNYGNGYIGCHIFYNAIKKYGWNNFRHIVLFDHLTKEEAEEIEIELITFHKSNDRRFGYNIENGGNTQGTHSEETRRKISESNKGKKISAEVRKKLSEKQKMRFKDKNNHPLFGKKMSEETKKKISNANKGKNAWNSGIKNCFTEETLIKISDSLKGKHPSQETRVKMSVAKKGKNKGKNNPMYGVCGEKNVNSKKIICVENNTIYNSMTEVSNVFKLSLSLISMCCNGKIKSAGGYHFNFIKNTIDK